MRRERVENMKPEDARIGQFVQVQFTGKVVGISRYGVTVSTGQGIECYIPLEAAKPLTQEELLTKP